jgi:hypothetical protein
MKCPRCESRKLWIHVRFSGYVLCESSFDDAVEISQSSSMNSDWDEESPCRCHACHWTGSVGDVRELVPGGTLVRTRQSVTTVAEVKRRLKAQPCPVVWSDCIRYLLARLQASEERIHQQAQVIKQQSLRKNDGDTDETKIM